MNKNTITIAGVKLDEEKFPRLYRWAKVNPEGLEETLRGLAKASGGSQDDLRTDARNLEEDLAHG